MFISLNQINLVLKKTFIKIYIKRFSQLNVQLQDAIDHIFMSSPGNSLSI